MRPETRDNRPSPTQRTAPLLCTESRGAPSFFLLFNAGKLSLSKFSLSLLTITPTSREHPAEEVYVTGTFDNWTKSVKLDKEGSIFQKTVKLENPSEKIYYKVSQYLSMVFSLGFLAPPDLRQCRRRITDSVVLAIAVISIALTNMSANSKFWWTCFDVEPTRYELQLRLGSQPIHMSLACLAHDSNLEKLENEL